MSIPSITVTIDAEKDTDRFMFFLTNDQYRAKRRNILQFYPPLRTRIENGESVLVAVRDEILNMYNRFTTQVQHITSVATKEFSESAPAFSALAQIMDFPQLEKHSYVAHPTFLPFSPLNNNVFYFSIAREIAGRPHTPNAFLTIAVHEISHFIFSEQYSTIEKSPGCTLNKPTYHFVKEALTAAIMNQHEFTTFFDYPSLFHSDEYPGNHELHNLFIEQFGRCQPIIRFFEQGVMQSSDGYRNGLRGLCQVLAAANDAFSDKWKLWNDQPNTTAEQREWEKAYRQPIKLLDH